MEEQISQAERDLRSIQTREERAMTLFVSGRITKRLENVRSKLDDYRAWTASGTEKLRLKEAVFAWARDVGQGLDELTPEQRKEFLQMVVEEIIVHSNDKVDVALAIPIGNEPTKDDPVAGTPESSPGVRHNSFGKLRYSCVVELDATG